MSDTGQIILVIGMWAVAIGAIIVATWCLGYGRGRDKEYDKAVRRKSDGPEFMATGCTFQGRPIYLEVKGYGDLEAAGEAVRNFKANQEGGT